MPRGFGYIIGVGLAVALVGGTYGCAAPAEAESDRQLIDYYEYNVRTLPDGRKLECLTQASGVGYAVTCNWAGAKKP